MWFSVYDYLKFIVEGNGSLTEKFEAAGFITYQNDYSRNWWDGQHWLDDYEYTFFVLRYS